MMITMNFGDHAVSMSFNDEKEFKAEIENEVLYVKNSKDELIERHCLHNAVSVEIDP